MPAFSFFTGRCWGRTPWSGLPSSGFLRGRSGLAGAWLALRHGSAGGSRADKRPLPPRARAWTGMPFKAELEREAGRGVGRRGAPCAACHRCVDTVCGLHVSPLWAVACRVHTRPVGHDRRESYHRRRAATRPSSAPAEQMGRGAWLALEYWCNGQNAMPAGCSFHVCCQHMFANHAMVSTTPPDCTSLPSESTLPKAPSMHAAVAHLGCITMQGGRHTCLSSS